MHGVSFRVYTSMLFDSQIYVTVVVLIGMLPCDVILLLFTSAEDALFRLYYRVGHYIVR